MITVGNLNFKIGEAGKVFIIAEAGYNHDGDVEKAKELIRQAKKVGADAVKFQIVKADSFVSPNITRSRDEEAIMKEGDNLYWELKRAELSDEDYHELLDLAKKVGIIFFASFTEQETADFLVGLGVPLLKLASGELTNLPFLQYVALKRLPMILSTGMGTMEEVHQAVMIITATGNRQLCLLHSTSCYPTQPQDVNLRAMVSLRKAFPDFPVGYSDHTLGPLASVLAVSLGAAIIEKHFTLDKTKPGSDHSISMEPREFAQMVQMIRQVEVLLGNSLKSPSPSEREMRILARRSIVAKRNIAKGETLSSEKIALIRPAKGLDPSFWNKVAGKKTKYNLSKGEVLTLDKIEWE